jgi:mono/diheme cytochrome c family protein
VRYSVVDRKLWFAPSVSLRSMLAYELVLADGVKGIDGSAPRTQVPSVFVTGNVDEGRLPSPPDPSFADDIGPLLETRCSRCHGGARPSAGLVLWPSERLGEAFAASSGEWVGWRVIAVGSPERSYLLYKVTGSPGLVGERMPPGDALTRDQAAALERWMALGAPH